MEKSYRLNDIDVIIRDPADTPEVGLAMSTITAGLKLEGFDAVEVDTYAQWQLRQKIELFKLRPIGKWAEHKWTNCWFMPTKNNP